MENNTISFNIWISNEDYANTINITAPTNYYTEECSLLGCYVVWLF
jgi:hypothetical protein